MKSFAYISIYLSFFGWLFGSNEKATKKEKESTKTTEIDTDDSESSGISENIEENNEPQIEIPLLFPNGLPIENAQTPLELGHPSAQNCGTCHTSIYEQWKFDGHGHKDALKNSYGNLRLYINRGDGLPFKDSPSCQNCHLPVAKQHHRTFEGYVDNKPQRPQYVENNDWSPLLYSEGVTCISCHARENQILGLHLYTSPSKEQQDTFQDSSEAIVADTEINHTDLASQNTTDKTNTILENNILENTPIQINVSPTSFVRSDDRVHSAIPSSELSQSELCSTCHQSQEISGGIYNTYTEWKNSTYAENDVGCVSCHYQATAVLDGSSSYGTMASHNIHKDLWEGLAVDISLSAPVVQRGQKTPLKIALINTGSGHAIPTSPWKQYNFIAEIQDEKQKTLWKSSNFVLGSNVNIIKNPQTMDTQEPTEDVDNLLEKTTDQKEQTETVNSIQSTHILTKDSGISILPFQRHIWSEEIDISVKKSVGIATLIITETTTQHVFIRSTLEIR